MTHSQDSGQNERGRFWWGRRCRGVGEGKIAYFAVFL